MFKRNCFSSRVAAIAVALMFLLLFAGASTPVAQAAAITVNDTSGGHSTTTCTLRDAITAANTDTPAGGCLAGSGADTIVLPISLFTQTTITLTEVDNGTAIETNGLPVITSNITINGNGAIIQRSSLRGTPAFRIFRVGIGTLTLNNVTIRNGRTPDGTASYPGGYGGGIANSGTLTITNSTISGNRTGDGAAGSGYDGGIGGGIYNANALNVTNSTISGNRTGSGNVYGGHGGGIASNNGTVTIISSTISGNATGNGATNAGWGGGIYNSAKMTIQNSTISGNTTGSGTGSGGPGGGIYNYGFGIGECLLSITNSTISGNGTGTPNASGGGIASSGTLTVTSSTIARNSASGGGGGVYRDSALLHLRNTIVANNLASDHANCVGTITNGGNNLDSGTTCGWDTTSGSMSDTNPMLAPLGNYGGPTQTMALVRGSPAIDGVNWNPPNGSPSIDQRGVARPVGSAHDIGAFEGSVLLLQLPLIRK